MNLTLKSFAVVFVSGKESYTFLLFICIPEEKKKKKKKKKNSSEKLIPRQFISEVHALTSLFLTILQYLTISLQ